MEDVEFLTKHPFVKNAVPISLGDAYQQHRIIGQIKILFQKFITQRLRKENSLIILPRL